MNKVDTFFAYMGNKAEIADWIIPFFPQHKIYVEVFGGTGSILLNKRKSPIEFYNDINPHLSNLFEVNRVMHNDFKDAIREIRISEYIYDRFYDNHNDYTVFPNLENAVRFFYIMCLAHMGKYTGGFMWKDEENFGYTFERKIKVLEDINKRTKNLVVLNKDFRKIIKQFGQKENALIYLDPPYVNTEGYYKHLAGEFNETDHLILRDMLAKAKCNFYLSYEDNEMINELYKDFHILRKNKFRPGTKDKRSVEEIVITNYQPQNLLFNLDETYQKMR